MLNHSPHRFSSHNPKAAIRPPTPAMMKANRATGSGGASAPNAVINPNTLNRTISTGARMRERGRRVFIRCAPLLSTILDQPIVHDLGRTSPFPRGEEFGAHHHCPNTHSKANARYAGISERCTGATGCFCRVHL